MKNKNARLVLQWLLIPAIVLIVVRLFVKWKGYAEAEELLKWMSLVLIFSALIVWVTDRFFPEWYDKKK